MSVNRGLFPAFAQGASPLVLNAAVIGAGAAAPTVPATGVYPAGLNAVDRSTAGVPTRSAAGTYVIKLGENLRPPVITNVVPSVKGADGRTASVTAWDVTLGTISVQCRDDSGADDDLETTDTLILTIFGNNSMSAQ